MSRVEKELWIIFLVGALVVAFQDDIIRGYRNIFSRNVSVETPRKNIIEYYETTVEYTYKDLTTDTVVVNIYESPVCKLVNGDLTYWKITWATGGAVAGVTTIASYVRSFKILSSNKKTIS